MGGRQSKKQHKDRIPINTENPTSESGKRNPGTDLIIITDKGHLPVQNLSESRVYKLNGSISSQHREYIKNATALSDFGDVELTRARVISNLASQYEEPPICPKCRGKGDVGDPVHSTLDESKSNLVQPSARKANCAVNSLIPDSSSSISANINSDFRLKTPPQNPSITNAFNHAKSSSGSNSLIKASRQLSTKNLSSHARQLQEAEKSGRLSVASNLSDSDPPKGWPAIRKVKHKFSILEPYMFTIYPTRATAKMHNPRDKTRALMTKDVKVLGIHRTDNSKSKKRGHRDRIHRQSTLRLSRSGSALGLSSYPTHHASRPNSAQKMNSSKQDISASSLLTKTVKYSSETTERNHSSLLQQRAKNLSRSQNESKEMYRIIKPTLTRPCSRTRAHSDEGPSASQNTSLYTKRERKEYEKPWRIGQKPIASTSKRQVKKEGDCLPEVSSNENSRGSLALLESKKPSRSSNQITTMKEKCLPAPWSPWPTATDRPMIYPSDKYIF